MNRSRLCSPICALLLLLLVLPWNAQAQDQPVRIIFLHHSCGHNLIEEGGVREMFTARGYEFYDHGYNEDGLRLADGSYTGTHFDVPDDNTDPDGFARIFSQPLHDPPDNTFSHLMTYDVIIFKSCFPTSNIGSDEQLAEYQSYYYTIRERIDQYPDKIFIIVTQPPQVPGASDRAEAQRARAFANWLQSDEYLAGHPNLFTFDFFGLLAGDDNFLRSEYRYDNQDAHPNERANREIAPLFVDFVDQAIQSYYGSGPRPQPQPVEPLPIAEPIGAPAATGTIDDFESAAGGWEADAPGSSHIACAAEGGNVHGGSAALHIHHEIESWSYGWCGMGFDEPQDWSQSDGLALWLRTTGENQPIVLTVYSGNPDAATPFEVRWEAEEEWTSFVFPWSEWERASWAEESSLQTIDLTHITGLGFTIEAAEGQSVGDLWVDDIALFSEAGQPPSAPTEPEEPVEEPSAGPCPLSTVALPLGALVVLLARKRRAPPTLLPPGL